MATQNQSSIKLPDGVAIEKLKENWDTATREYYRAFRRAQLLDATDRGRLWEALKAKFPAYQILPDTNHVSYVKCNLVASIYTVCKSAKILPYSENDKDIVETINTWLDYFWEMAEVGDVQLKAGDRAALMNLGITQVGWDNEVSGKAGDFTFKGAPALKNIDPLKFMRDPYSESLETAGYCMTWDLFHKSILQTNPLYADSFKQYLASPQSGLAMESIPVEAFKDGPSASMINSSMKDYFKVIIHWIRVAGKVHEIHTIENRGILAVKEDIKPSTLPFAELYCNDPAGDLIGTSQPAKIFSNSLAYNMLNSIMMTAEYKNQRPPKFASTTSGLNLASFIKHGNEADYTFLVNGDATKAVHYQQFPTPSSNTPVINSYIGQDIKTITGVDERYTGRDTGSILTTGGIESMLDQVTLIDTPKVKNYERYTKRLTKLILCNMLEFSQKRKYFIKVPNQDLYKVIEIDFPNIDAATLFGYTISINSELPKNKARISQMANTLMEKQAQYNQSGEQVKFITPEEWLMLQDLPIKEYMMERMGIQRTADYQKKVASVLTMFAELTKQGVPGQEAIAMTAAQMQAEETPGMMQQEMPMAMDAGAPMPPQGMGMQGGPQNMPMG